MTVMPPPGWAFAAAVLAAVFGVLTVALVSKTPTGYDRHYAHFFAAIMATIGCGQLGLLIAYASIYNPGYTYSVRSSNWIMLYILGEWVLVIMAFVVTMSRQGKFPSSWPRLEFALQGFTSLYLIALSCNQLAAIVAKAKQHEVLHFGHFLFGMTTLILLMTAAVYLSMWTERRFFAKTTATADGDKINMVKRLGKKES